MGVGACACYSSHHLLPEREHHHPDPDVRIVLGRHRRSLLACLSLRIKGFYLAVATAAQFFLQWASCVPGCSTINARARSKCRSARSSTFRLRMPPPPRDALRLPWASIVLLTWFAHVHGKLGRSWMAVRDMDTPPS